MAGEWSACMNYRPDFRCLLAAAGLVGPRALRGRELGDGAAVHRTDATMNSTRCRGVQPRAFEGLVNVGLQSQRCGRLSGRGTGVEFAGGRTSRSAPVFFSACNEQASRRDRKSTRLNSSHLVISYAVFCFKKKKLCS